MTRDAGRRPLLVPALCLLGSGGASLVYEVTWARRFALEMGHTAPALAAVLAAFLGGLGLGAWLGGRWTARRGASLRDYAAVELAVAGWALAMPALIAATAPAMGTAYRAFADAPLAHGLTQLGLAALLIVPAAAAMGATLPIAVHAFTPPGSEVSRPAGVLYGVNTAGGALGAALCGFVLLPALGTRAAELVAVLLNLAVAFAAWALRRGSPRTPPPSRAAEARPARLRTAPLAALYAAAGASALMLEVGWARAVGLSIGSTSFGLSIALVAFIVNLGLGGLLAARLPLVSRHPRTAAAAASAAVALGALVSLPVIGDLPLLVIDAIGDPGLGFGDVMAREAAIVWATIALPTLAMGVLYPAAVALFRERGAGAGAAAGTAYAANTAGNVIGAVAAGFVLIPAIGMRGTIVAAAVLSAAVAAALLVPRLRERGRRLRPAVAILALAALVTVLAWRAPGWDRATFSSGPYLWASFWKEQEAAGRSVEAALEGLGRLVYYREDASTVVSVLGQADRSLRMQVSGYTDATSYGSTQDLIAHLPLAVHGDARDVLVIGLGGGVTLGCALAYPLERVECVEISPAVREAAALLFAPYNGNALADPRVRVRIGDGRSHLRHGGRRYDVIVSQPSMPWISGAAALFTHEAFLEMKGCLAPGGVACVWYQAWGRAGEDLEILLRTFAEAFPGALLFESRILGDYVVLGRAEDAPIDVGRMQRALARPEVRASLGRIGFADAVDLLGLFMMGAQEIRALTAGAPINADDRSLIEFKAARGLLARDPLAELERLHSARVLVLDHLAPPPVPEEIAVRLRRIAASKPLVLEARRIEGSEGRGGRWRSIVDAILALNPRDPYALQAQGTRAPSSVR